MSSPPRKRSSSGRAEAGHPLLVLAQPSAETDDLLADLLQRPDFHVLRVATVEAAGVALRDLDVSLVLVCAQTSRESIEALLAEIDVLRPGIPVLAVRERSGEESAAWRGRAVGILRAPLLPRVLSRSVDVALGLSHRRDSD